MCIDIIGNSVYVCFVTFFLSNFRKKFPQILSIYYVSMGGGGGGGDECLLLLIRGRGGV